MIARLRLIDPILKETKYTKHSSGIHIKKIYVTYLSFYNYGR